jgi:hypothetical protein
MTDTDELDLDEAGKLTLASPRPLLRRLRVRPGPPQPDRQRRPSSPHSRRGLPAMREQLQSRLTGLQLEQEQFADGIMRLVQIRARTDEDAQCLMRELASYSPTRTRHSILVEARSEF